MGSGLNWLLSKVIALTELAWRLSILTNEGIVARVTGSQLASYLPHAHAKRLPSQDPLEKEKKKWLLFI